MTLTSHRRSFADQMSMGVAYAGETVQKMFAFRNGSALVTDLYPTLEEAVARWGNRIETGDKTMRFSGPYKAGQDDAMAHRAYNPDRRGGKQAVLEYGTGYLCGMLERKDKPEPAAPLPAPTPDVSDELEDLV